MAEDLYALEEAQQSREKADADRRKKGCTTQGISAEEGRASYAQFNTQGQSEVDETPSQSISQSICQSIRPGSRKASRQGV